MDSAVGFAIRTQRSVDTTDLESSLATYESSPFNFNSSQFVAVFVVPFSLNVASKKTNAALAVYKRSNSKSFEQSAKYFIETAAHLVPQLYEAIGNRVGQKLSSQINGILDEARFAVGEGNSSRKSSGIFFDNIKITLGRICNLVSSTFQCVETSLFLENQFETEQCFTLFASSYPDWIREKAEYLPKKTEGLTGWVLSERKPLMVVNLLTFANDQEHLQRLYPGIKWNDSLNLGQSLKNILNVTEEMDLPALSFMAVPIISNGKLLGVIRCSASKQAPWHFSIQLMRLLESVAVLVGNFWNDSSNLLQEKKEAESWQRLVEDINWLNDQVQKRLDRSEMDKAQLLDYILRIAKSTIDGADILDIRLLDETSNELYFASTLGNAWNKGSKAEIKGRKSKRYPLLSDVNDKNVIGVESILTGKVQNITDINSKMGYSSDVFPETKRLIVAPIGTEDKNIGVLDIRGIGWKPFSTNALNMAELISRQLGLYLSLWERERQQKQVFEDTWHQLKSPIRNIFARSNQIVDDFFEKYSENSNSILQLETELWKLRGTARKANRVLSNAGIYTELAGGGELRLPKDFVPLTRNNTIKMLIEITSDVRLLLENYRNIKFSVNRRSFEGLDKIVVKANIDYLAQALNCLIDNAGKYSFADTTIIISGGEEQIDNRRYFYIEVKNQGLEILPEELPLLVRRAYRGSRAKMTTGEGSGIGLWVTNHIMKVHEGQLIVRPTSAGAWNVVKLLLPILD